MNFLICGLLISTAYCSILSNNKYNGDFNWTTRKNLAPYELTLNSQESYRGDIVPNLKIRDRVKRDIDVTKNSEDSFDLKAKKDLLNDENKKLTAFGSIDGLKQGSGYDSIHGGLNFENAKGNSFDLSGLHTKTENKVSGEGVLNLFNTNTQSLTAKGFGEKTWRNYDTLTKYGGSLDYLNKNGASATLSAKHDSSIGDLFSAQGKYMLLNKNDQKVNAEGYWNRNSPINSSPIDNYGASLNFLNTRKGNSAALSAKHDSSFGDHISAQGKYMLLNNNDYNLNAKVYWNRDVPINSSPVDSYGGSLNYLNTRKGNSASILAQRIPDLGDQISLAGKYNIFHNDNHDLHASGKFARTFPLNSKIGNYNEYSGNLDYLYKNKFGLDLGVKHSDLLSRSDYSATGNLNLFRDGNSHLDMFGGLTKSVSPTFNSPWTPSVGLKFEKSF